MHRSIAVVSLVLLLGCPGPPPDDGTGSGGTAGGEVPTTAAELSWPDSPLSDLARRETLEALEAMSEPPWPLAFLVRLDVGFEVDDAGDGSAARASTRWVRFGVLLADDGLHVFDARPIAVTGDAYGEPLDAQPLAPLARAVAELELLEPAACESVGGEAVCAPLLALVAESAEPTTLVGEARPTRLAAGDRALLGRTVDGGPAVVDLTISGAPRLTDIGENPGEGAAP